MTGDVSIETVNIGSVVVLPGAADWAEFLQAQIDAGATGETLAEEGIIGSPDEAPEPGGPPLTDEELAEDAEPRAKRISQEMVAAYRRSDNLHQLVSEVDKANNMRGFQTNHDRHPDNPGAVGRIRAAQAERAKQSLAAACASCIFRGHCRLEGDLERWLDVHPYKKGHKGERRPGSGPVTQVETRSDFIGVIRKDPDAHCDPAKRK